jgi:hypothetical protein
MKLSTMLRPAMLAAACFGTMLMCRPVRADLNEAIASSINDKYTRTRLSDGSYKPEAYSFGNGGYVAGPVRDDSISQLTFMDVAKVVVGPLAEHNYVPSNGQHPEDTKLLIMVFWGTTHGVAGATSSEALQKLQSAQSSITSAPPPPELSSIAHCSCDASQVDAGVAAMANGIREGAVTSSFAVMAAENRMRDQADMRNAILLGYDTELASAQRMQQTAFRNRQSDLLAEIEDNRDFVVLQAFDFQAMWKHKKRELMWATRLSVRQRGTNFSSALPGMVIAASRYFGQESHGLLRESVREGQVEIGPVKSLGALAQK